MMLKLFDKKRDLSQKITIIILTLPFVIMPLLVIFGVCIMIYVPEALYKSFKETIDYIYYGK